MLNVHENTWYHDTVGFSNIYTYTLDRARRKINNLLNIYLFSTIRCHI